jgi:DNA polymerase I-like protein with 3'-5' exonuclease and polymerase domains
MALQYPGLHGEPNAFGGYDFTFGKGKKLYGAHFTENCIQALARVLLSQQHLQIQAELDSNYGRDVARVVHSIHDELVVIAPEQHGDDIYQMMGGVMSKSPDWAPTLPLKSEGGIAREYSK